MKNLFERFHRFIKYWPAVVIPAVIVITWYFLTSYGHDQILKLSGLILLSAWAQVYLWRPFPKSYLAFALGVAGALGIAVTFLHIVSPQAITPEKYRQECYGFASLTLLLSVILLVARQIGIFAKARLHHIIRLIALWMVIVVAGGVGFYIFDHWLQHPNKYSQDGIELVVVGFWLGFTSIAAGIDVYALGKKQIDPRMAENCLAEDDPLCPE